MKKIILSFAVIIFAVATSMGQAPKVHAYSTNGTVNNDLATTPGLSFFLSVDAYSTGNGSSGNAYSRAYLTKWYSNAIIADADINISHYGGGGGYATKTKYYSDNCGNVAHAYVTAQVYNGAPGVTGWADGGITW
jgi:hypothetical protein